MRRNALIIGLSIVLAFAAGLPIGGLFFGQECAQDNPVCPDSENEMLVSDLETAPIYHWWELPHKHDGKPIYTIDNISDDAAVSIFSDGQVYRERNRVVLSDNHRRRIRKLYNSISGEKKRLEDK